MGKPRVLVTFRVGNDLTIINKLKPIADVIWNQEGDLTMSEILKFIPNVEGLILGWEINLTKKLLKQARRLEIIGKLGGGVGNIDTDTVFTRNITLVNAARACAIPTAELALGLMLDCLRDISQRSMEMKTGTLWERRLGRELTGKTIGIIGVGFVAKKLVEFLHGFKSKIIAYHPRMSNQEAQRIGIELKSLQGVLLEAEIISIHAALNEETWHMLGKKELDMIRPGTILINTARGPIVDENALVERLKRGDIKAALDVFETEPLPLESELRRLDNVVLTPHIGGSQEFCPRAREMVAEDIALYFKGKPPKNRLSKEKVERMTKW